MQGWRLACWPCRYPGGMRQQPHPTGRRHGGLKGSAVSVLIAQGDLNHSRKLVDAEFVVERGADVAPAPALD